MFISKDNKIVSTKAYLPFSCVVVWKCHVLPFHAKTQERQFTVCTLRERRLKRRKETLTNVRLTGGLRQLPAEARGMPDLVITLTQLCLVTESISNLVKYYLLWSAVRLTWDLMTWKGR